MKTYFIKYYYFTTENMNNMTKAQIDEQIAMLTQMRAYAPDTTNEDRWSGLIHKFNKREKIYTLNQIYEYYDVADMVSHLRFARMYVDMLGYTKPKKKGRPAKAKVVKEKQPRKRVVSRIPATLYQQIYFKDGEEFTQSFTMGKTIRHFVNEHNSIVEAKYQEDTNDFKCSIANPNYMCGENNQYIEFTCNTLGDAMKRNWEVATGKTIYELNEEIKKINRDKNGGKVNHKTLKVGLTTSMYDERVGFKDFNRKPIGHRDLCKFDFEGFGDTKGREWDNENICNIQNKTWTIDMFKSFKNINDWIEPKKLTIKKNKNK